MGRSKNMGKSQKQVGKSLILTKIFMTIFIIIMSLFTVGNCILIKKITKDNKKIETELTNIKNDVTKINNDVTKINNEYEQLTNIDKLINDTKKEVFSLAKEVENKIINGTSSYKIAYITFDDGPYYLTNNVLDTLKEKEVKATFFTIGLDKDTCYDNKSKSCYDTYKTIVDNGHTIANHTYSHGIFKGLYSSPDNFINDVKKQEELIQKRTGVKTNIVRFPGGSGTANSLTGGSVNSIKQKLRDNGYGWVDWTAQDGDGGYLPNYDTAWNNFTNGINENIEVILFHDYSNITYRLLPNAIDYLENNNYIILPLFYESVKINK